MSSAFTNAIGRGFRSLFGIKPKCQHVWYDAYDFVSCSLVTLYTDDRQPTSVPQTIQTMQWCPTCGEHRRKPNSARAATNSETA